MLWTMDLSELLPFPLPSLLLRRSQRLCCESELDTDDERFITDIVALYDAVSCVLVVAVSAFPWFFPYRIVDRRRRRAGGLDKFVIEGQRAVQLVQI
jgi:hypothetical protein